MKRIEESHVDHGLSDEQLAHVMELFKDKDAFFIETIELPEELGTVPCGLHGPVMGDEPVAEDEVSYKPRNGRPYDSRLCPRESRQVRQVSVIAGPNGDDPCVLYTAFGGPVAPQELGDEGCRDIDESKKFWAEHALSE